MNNSLVNLSIRFNYIFCLANSTGFLEYKSYLLNDDLSQKDSSPDNLSMNSRMLRLSVIRIPPGSSKIGTKPLLTS